MQRILWIKIILSAAVALAWSSVRADDSKLSNCEAKNTATPEPSTVALSIRPLRFTYGHLGPERKNSRFYPQEVIFFRADIDGIQTDGEDRGSLSIEVELLDREKKSISGWKQSQSGKGSFGTGHVSFTAIIQLDRDRPSGDYFVRLTVTDLLSDQTAIATRDITVLPRAFALITPRAFVDEERRVPAPFGGAVGQRLWITLSIIGEEHEIERNVFSVELEVYDEQGRQLSSAWQDIDIPRRPSPEADVLIHHSMSLSRVGRFNSRWRVTERATGKTFVLEIPIVTNDPSEEPRVAGETNHSARD